MTTRKHLSIRAQEIKAMESAYAALTAMLDVAGTYEMSLAHVATARKAAEKLYNALNGNRRVRRPVCAVWPKCDCIVQGKAKDCVQH